MMKFIALVVFVAGAVVASAYTTYPTEFRQTADTASATAPRVWASVEANPAPVLVALGTFLLTIIYHKLKGKSLKESVEVAATRVTVVNVPAPTTESDNAIVKRAQARATRTQLIADQIGLENRIRKLPEEVRRAEQEVCYADKAMVDAEEALTAAEEAMEAKIEAHKAASAKLEALRREQAAGASELDAIATELKKLADVV